MRRERGGDGPVRRAPRMGVVWTALTLVVAAAVVGSAAVYNTRRGPPAAPPVVSREEFRRAVLGKTPAEVVEAVGRPARTSDTQGGWLYYYYRRRTFDPVTGSVDDGVQVTFDRGTGRCDGVNY